MSAERKLSRRELLSYTGDGIMVVGGVSVFVGFVGVVNTAIRYYERRADIINQHRSAVGQLNTDTATGEIVETVCNSNNQTQQRQLGLEEQCQTIFQANQALEGNMQEINNQANKGAKNSLFAMVGGAIALVASSLFDRKK